MPVVKIGWSGGKDSTCSVLLHLEQGDTVKACCYIPMFTKDIPLIRKNHYEFILKSAQILRKMGAEVYIVSGMTYWDYVTYLTVKGENKGKIFGFPCYITSKCNFKRYSKLKSLNELDVGNFDYEDIGIAFDEIERHPQLNDKKRSILVEKQITEAKATQICRERGLLSPHYETDTRDGCALCPQKKPKDRELWLSDYPQARQLVIELQEIVKKERPDRPPLRQYKYFIDTDQVDMFGNYLIN